MLSAATLIPLSERNVTLLPLARFRWWTLLLISLLLVVAVISGYPLTHLPLMVGILLVLALSNGLLHWVRPSHYHWPVLSLCLLDIAGLGWLLQLTGGASNGFVTLLLLPVAVAALMLRRPWHYLITLLAVVVYGLLLHAGQSAAGHGLYPATSSLFSLHLWHMWCGFIIAALLVSSFVSRQARLIRMQASELAQAQQQQIRHEQVLGMATYAASAAHDLASPIQTLTLLAAEPLAAQQDPGWQRDFRQQIERCQQLVKRLRSNAGQLREASKTPMLLVSVLEQAVYDWQASRGDIQVNYRQNLTEPQRTTHGAVMVSAAISNILDNAADASVQCGWTKINVTLTAEQQYTALEIIDGGEGLSAQRLAELGQLPLDSETGMGLGQFLANLSIEQSGGHIERTNHADGGLKTLIQWEHVS